MTRAAYGSVPAQARQQEMQLAAEEHLPLVSAVLKRFPHQCAETEELYQQGCIGLMKALARYDPDRGAFSTYAVAMIMGEMRMLRRQNAPVHIPRQDRELRSRVRRVSALLEQQLHREPTVQEIACTLRMDAAELTFLLEDVQVTSTDAPVGEAGNLLACIPDTDGWEMRMELRDMISRLPEKDFQLLMLRYRYGLSQREAGLRLGLTQSQVSRREAVILRQLREQWADG